MFADWQGGRMKPLRSTAPAHSLLNPARPYVPAAATDVAATFARIRKQQEQAARTNTRKQRGTFDLVELTLIAIVLVSALFVLLITADKIPMRTDCGPVMREASRAVADEYRFQVAKAAQEEINRGKQK